MTAEEYAATVDEGLSELVRGEVVRWPFIFPAAGYVCANVAYEIDRYVRPRRLGLVVTNNCGVHTEHDPDTVRSPDVAYHEQSRLPHPLPDDRYLIPDLVVELISLRVPEAGLTDRVAEYLTAGIKVVCTLDPEAAVLTAYPHDAPPRRYTRDEAVELPELFPDFSVPVRAFLD